MPSPPGLKELSKKKRHFVTKGTMQIKPKPVTVNFPNEKKRVRLILIGKTQNLTTFCRISIFFFFFMGLQIFLCQELAGLKQARLNAYKSVLVCLFFSFQAIKRFFEK